MTKEDLKDWDFIKPIGEHIKDLMLKTEQELIDMRIKEWIYQLEYADPKNIGKPQAIDAIAQYQKRQKYLKENLEIMEKYCSDHGIGIEL